LLFLLLSALVTAAVPGPPDDRAPVPPARAGALAPLPTAEELAAWSVVDYNAYIIDNQFAVMREIDRSLKAFYATTPSEETYEAFRRQGRQNAEAGLVNARMLAPWKGDSSFRGAMVLGYTVMLRIFDEDLPVMWTLVNKTEVRNADLAELEKLQRQLDDESTKTNAAIQEAQAEFARKHGFVIVDASDAPEYTLPPAFTAPGIPPADSVLAGATHAGFAMRYHNALVERQVRIMEAANAVMVATSGDVAELDRVREASLENVRVELAATRASEDWQGDDALRLALLELGERTERLLADDFATYTLLRQQAKVSAEEIDRLNAIAAASGPILQGAIDGFSAAQQTFQTRWGLAAYDQWRRELWKVP
jgi:hypothetical protein